MGVGWGVAAFATSIWVAVPFVVAGAAGNGAAIICNQLLVQRGAPDRYRGRALATIMSSNYAVLGLAMAAAGVLTDAFGARWVWTVAGVVYLVAAGVALVLTSWLPVAAGGGGARRVEAAARGSAATRTRRRRRAVKRAATRSRSRLWFPSPWRKARRRTALERIATLLEQIEERRELEQRRRR